MDSRLNLIILTLSVVLVAYSNAASIEQQQKAYVEQRGAPISKEADLIDGSEDDLLKPAESAWYGSGYYGGGGYGYSGYPYYRSGYGSGYGYGHGRSFGGYYGGGHGYYGGRGYYPNYGYGHGRYYY